MFSRYLVYTDAQNLFAHKYGCSQKQDEHKTTVSGNYRCADSDVGVYHRYCVKRNVNCPGAAAAAAAVATVAAAASPRPHSRATLHLEHNGVNPSSCRRL